MVMHGIIENGSERAHFSDRLHTSHTHTHTHTHTHKHAHYTFQSCSECDHLEKTVETSNLWVMQSLIF